MPLLALKVLKNCCGKPQSLILQKAIIATVVDNNVSKKGQNT